MTPWPTGVPKPDAVRNYIMDRDTIRQLDDTRNAVAYADAMLAECAETIERQAIDLERWTERGTRDSKLIDEMQATIERLDGMLRLAIKGAINQRTGLPPLPSEIDGALADLARRYAEQEGE